MCDRPVIFIICVPGYGNSTAVNLDAADRLTAEILAAVMKQR
jgi:hypothetical protein